MSYFALPHPVRARAAAINNAHNRLHFEAEFAEGKSRNRAILKLSLFAEAGEASPRNRAMLDLSFVHLTPLHVSSVKRFNQKLRGRQIRGKRNIVPVTEHNYIVDIRLVGFRIKRVS